jgi:hypothetical protein
MDDQETVDRTNGPREESIYHNSRIRRGIGSQNHKPQRLPVCRLSVDPGELPIQLILCHLQDLDLRYNVE